MPGNPNNTFTGGDDCPWNLFGIFLTAAKDDFMWRRLSLHMDPASGN